MENQENQKDNDFITQEEVERIRTTAEKISKEFKEMKRIGIDSDILEAYLRIRTGEGRTRIRNILRGEKEFYQKLKRSLDKAQDPELNLDATDGKWKCIKPKCDGTVIRDALSNSVVCLKCDQKYKINLTKL